MSEKVEIMSIGSNQVNVNGSVVSKSHWEGYSPDGKNINLNFYSNGKEGKIRNLDLHDFGFLIRESLKNDEDDRLAEIKGHLNPLSTNFKEIIDKKKAKKQKKHAKKKYSKLKDSLLLNKRRTEKKKRNKSEKGSTKKKRNKSRN
jgi:hypothetical protein|tara:strand:- start:1210 stop:1644 length:435 start_codon:yes stop_codon:yes gene_type:complete